MNTLNCRGCLIDVRTAVIMGIINVNNDSFYMKSRHDTHASILASAGKMLSEGATILDLGGVSTRPNASSISVQTELERVIPAIDHIKQSFPDSIISIDTFNPEVAANAIDAGASIINDITAGGTDDEMLHLAKEKNCTYIMMHMQGTPQTMQINPSYKDVVLEILDFFIEKVGKAKAIGLHDLVIDPGFGFGKTITHNYQLLNGLHVFNILDKPLLAGISRKGMLWKPLNSSPEEVLPASIAANLVALQKGAKILRVHDVEATMQLLKTFELLQQNNVK